MIKIIRGFRFIDYLSLASVLMMFFLLLSLLTVTIMNDKRFDDRCKEAGGVLSHDKHECFHPSALMRLE